MVHLSVVACGDRLEETVTMIKSAMLFSKVLLHVHIFADDNLQVEFVKQVKLMENILICVDQKHV